MRCNAAASVTTLGSGAAVMTSNHGLSPASAGLAAAAGGGVFVGAFDEELDGGSGEGGCSRPQAANVARTSNNIDARATIDPVVEVVRMEWAVERVGCRRSAGAQGVA